MLRTIITLMLLLISGTALAETITIASNSPTRGQIQVPAQFEPPPGQGPFPVIILLGGCGSVEDTSTPVWAQLMRQWGYATLRVDTLGARGQTYGRRVCASDSLAVEMATEQAVDFFYAAYAIGQRPDVRHDKIAVFGRSLGGSALVSRTARDLDQYNRFRPLLTGQRVDVVGGVALFPGCSGRAANSTARFVMPVLIISAALDEETLAAPSVALGRLWSSTNMLQVKVIANAYHAFDLPSAGNYLGHHSEYNFQAFQAAQNMTQQFFSQILK